MRLIRFFILLAIIGFTSQSFGQSSAELKRRKNELTREIEMLRKSLSKTSSNKTLSLRQVNALNAKIRLREEKITTINSEIRLLNNQISENTSTIRSLQSQLNKLKKDYASMVLFAFRNQSAYSKLMFIFAAKDFNQAYKRLKYLQQFGEYRQKQAKYIQETQAELKAKIAQLDRNKHEKSGLLQDQEKEKRTLGKEKQNRSAELSKLSRQEKTLKQEISKKQAESARLNRAIQAAIAREIEEARKKAEAEAKKSGSEKPAAKGASILAATPEAAKLSADFLSNRGRLPWPVAAGTVVERFGRHSYGVNVQIENNGIDIKTNEGAAVRAVFSGDVSRVTNIGNSYVVLIRHGEYFTVYSNLRSASVSQGQKVSVKQTIGTVLTDPSDGTTQLHFEIRKVTLPMNPESWLAK